MSTASLVTEISGDEAGASIVDVRVETHADEGSWRKPGPHSSGAPVRNATEERIRAKVLKHFHVMSDLRKAERETTETTILDDLKSTWCYMGLGRIFPKLGGEWADAKVDQQNGIARLPGRKATRAPVEPDFLLHFQELGHALRGPYLSKGDALLVIFTDRRVPRDAPWNGAAGDLTHAVLTSPNLGLQLVSRNMRMRGDEDQTMVALGADTIISMPRTRYYAGSRGSAQLTVPTALVSNVDLSMPKGGDYVSDVSDVLYRKLWLALTLMIRLNTSEHDVSRPDKFLHTLVFSDPSLRTGQRGVLPAVEQAIERFLSDSAGLLDTLVWLNPDTRTYYHFESSKLWERKPRGTHAKKDDKVKKAPKEPKSE